MNDYLATMNFMDSVKLHHVSKRYHNNIAALHDVSLTIEKNQWIAVMGPSGSGKSTLLNIIGGLDRPTEGSAIVEGQELSDLSSQQVTAFRRDKVGFIFQQFYLIPYLTALENVMLAQYFHSMPDEQEAGEALKKVGLAQRLHHLPGELSGGEQQRVCIARALINHPRLILADEPTGNLDEENERIVLTLLEELHAEGHTIIVVTHAPHIGERAEKIIRLNHGRIVGTQALHDFAVPVRT
jgi:putative ABC transport system ATP-binding protein